jgi:hypothetical protein
MLAAAANHNQPHVSGRIQIEVEPPPLGDLRRKKLWWIAAATPNLRVRFDLEVKNRRAIANNRHSRFARPRLWFRAFKSKRDLI